MVKSRSNKVSGLRASTLIVAALTTAICASQRLEAHEKFLKNNIHSVCEINKNISVYVGKELLVTAEFQTDGGSFSYFKNNSHIDRKHSCKNSLNVIDIASMDEMHDSSVKKFFDKGDALCLKNGLSLCFRSADVLFKAQVLMRPQGPYLRITRIISYKEKSLKSD